MEGKHFTSEGGCNEDIIGNSSPDEYYKCRGNGITSLFTCGTELNIWHHISIHERKLFKMYVV